MTNLAAALALTAVALTVLPSRRRPTPSRAAARPSSQPGPVGPTGLRAALAGGVTLLASAAVLPDQPWLGVPAAAIAGTAVYRAARGRAGRRSAAQRGDLALALDLVAACLHAGMATGPALQAVASAVGESTVGGSTVGGSTVGGSTVGRSTVSGSTVGRSTVSGSTVGGSAVGGSAVGGSAVGGSTVGGSAGRAPDPGGIGRSRDPLGTVAAMLCLGADPRVAWAPVAEDPDLGPVAAAAERSAAGGAAFAGALREQAAALRARRTTEARRAAGRAGVLMAAPLGVCFLPAFLCLGLAPVVVGLIGQLDLW